MVIVGEWNVMDSMGGAWICKASNGPNICEVCNPHSCSRLVLVGYSRTLLTRFEFIPCLEADGIEERCKWKDSHESGEGDRFGRKTK